MDAATIVASLAALISIGSAYIAHRQASIAKIQAGYAKTSADAAVAQADSAKQSSDTSSKAFRLERLKIFQQAKQLLNAISNVCDGAVKESLHGGDQGVARKLIDIGRDKLNALAFLPVEPIEEFSSAAHDISSLCNKLFEVIKDAGFRLDQQEHLRVNALRERNEAQAAITDLILMLEKQTADQY